MPRFLPLTALIALLVASGCGDDEDGSGRTATVESGKPITVIADEYSFDPETIILTGGGELEVELDNRGTLAHNLRVFDGATDVGGTPTFVGGEPRAGKVRLDPGTYELVCTVGDHADLGMTGKLQVE